MYTMHILKKNNESNQNVIEEIYIRLECIHICMNVMRGRGRNSVLFLTSFIERHTVKPVELEKISPFKYENNNDKGHIWVI